MKLAILNHSEPLWWEKIGKAGNRAKSVIPIHSEPLWWKKIGKFPSDAKLVILSNFGG